MNRALVLTLVSMVGSVAAAVAAPEVDATSRVACLEAIAAAVPEAEAKEHPTTRPVGGSLGSNDGCGLEATERYLRWHHGGMRMMPACASTVSHT